MDRQIAPSVSPARRSQELAHEPSGHFGDAGEAYDVILAQPAPLTSELVDRAKRDVCTLGPRTQRRVCVPRDRGLGHRGRADGPGERVLGPVALT